MCGIIAIVRRRPERTAPAPTSVLERTDAALALAGALGEPDLEGSLNRLADTLADLDAMLGGVPGVTTLLAEPGLDGEIEQRLLVVGERLREVEYELAHTPVTVATEPVNVALLRSRDGLWAIERDRLRTARAVRELGGADVGAGGLGVLTSVQQALSALDRIEVRGRDSAGLHLLVRNHGLDLESPGVAAAIGARSTDPLFRSRAVRVADNMLSFVYKAAAEIGELGDNTAVLRAAVTGDELLAQALAADDVEAVVLGHTRWASVGIISEPNAHPVNSDQVGASLPYVTAVLNGDVDNFADLIAVNDLRIPAGITNDAKVIPTMVSTNLAAGLDPDEAFRKVVSECEGSVAIAASLADAPRTLHLALHGSGQGLFVGLAEDTFIVASEPYGVVEETPIYLRMDGETPANAEAATATRGQVISLDSAEAGTIGGIARWSYDGTPLPVHPSELTVSEITTRDIDRGDMPHYLLKELSEAPQSFRKTLRGRLVVEGDHLAVRLGPQVLPDELMARLTAGEITEIRVIGQGTAAVAGQSLAMALADALAETPVRVRAQLATELSGFGLRADMSDMLVVAISQSGTTTDTNRTVDLVRGRGAAVIAIVNRRNSDLTDKSDGVLYTSDGRDVEMSVASTKAFYSQIAAGFLLTCVLGDAVVGTPEAAAAERRQDLLRALLALPDAMEEVLTRRDSIGRAARRVCPSRRYWAIVGNGRNRIAAEEVRIKLSELCYKSIACDATEDKKHIDLSSEPLILVCAAGLVGSTGDDVAKEVAIYQAHKAAPVVIANEGDGRFTAATELIAVPSTHESLAFVLSAMAGHLFGYEAALAIDAQAQNLREARSVVDDAIEAELHGEALLRQVGQAINRPANQFFSTLRQGNYNGHLEASTATRLASSLRYALGISPLDSYQLDHGKVGTPGVVVDDLVSSLTAAIDELTRPIDAIKHQAKTVTVGISRSDESLLQVPLVAAVLEAGAPRDSLSYQSLRTLAELDPAVADVLGYTRYRVEGDLAGDEPRLFVTDRGGISLGIVSRTDTDPSLRGTKHLVATEQLIFVTQGRRDGRSIVIVPEVKDKQTVGLTLLQVAFADRLEPPVMRSVLQGYRNRYRALRDAVTETEPVFRDEVLGELPVADLMVQPVAVLAERWRS